MTHPWSSRRTTGFMNGNHRSLIRGYKYNAKPKFLRWTMTEISDLRGLLQRLSAHGWIDGGVDVVFFPQRVVHLLISGIIHQDRASHPEVSLATPESIVI